MTRFSDTAHAAEANLRALFPKNNVRSLLLPFYKPPVADKTGQCLFVWSKELAGATIPEIAAVTGHSHESCTQILKHYLAQHPEMASSAIAKMIAWYDADGETEIGL